MMSDVSDKNYNKYKNRVIRSIVYYLIPLIYASYTRAWNLSDKKQKFDLKIRRRKHE